MVSRPYIQQSLSPAISTGISATREIVDFMQLRQRPITMLSSILPAIVTRRLPQISLLSRSISLFESTVVDDDDENLLLWSETGENIKPLVDLADAPRVSTIEGNPEMCSGIDWKYAIQGSNLLNLSINDTTRPETASTKPSPDFIRQLYVHSLSYLIRGLPPNLTPEEILSLQTAIPASLLATTTSPIEPPVRRPSLLHRSLSNFIVFIFLLTSLILPYLRLIVRKMLECEQQHHIVARVLHGGVGVVDGAGRKGINASAAIWGIGVGESVGWILEEIGGGVREGVKEGVGRFREGS